MLKQRRNQPTLLVIVAALWLALPSRVTATSEATWRWAWTQDPWTGDDKPFTQIRTAIDKAIATGQNPDTLLSKYRMQAQKKPNDFQALFRWGYAAHKAVVKNATNNNEVLSRIWHVSEAMRLPSFPQTYQYTRVLFLMDVRAFPHPKLKQLGDRLIIRNPKDFDVKYFLIGLLNNSLSSKDRLRAISYAHDLIHAQPKQSRGYAALGGIYYERWLAKLDQSDGNMAVAAYQKYLLLAPQNRSFRKEAQRIINDIKSYPKRRKS